VQLHFTKLVAVPFMIAVFLGVLSANSLFLLVAKCIYIKHTKIHRPEMKTF
jgi:hypothetical protein